MWGAIDYAARYDALNVVNLASSWCGRKQLLAEAQTVEVRLSYEASDFRGLGFGV